MQQPRLIVITGYDSDSVENLFDTLIRINKSFFVKKHLFPERKKEYCHPKAMVQFAKDLVKQVNDSSSTIVVATFSDFFVKELNNCIMTYHVGNTAEKLGYTPDTQLDASLLQVYIIEENGFVRTVAIDEKYGIKESAFDTVVKQIDDNANSLCAAVELLNP